MLLSDQCDRETESAEIQRNYTKILKLEESVQDIYVYIHRKHKDINYLYNILPFRIQIKFQIKYILFHL